MGQVNMLKHLQQEMKKMDSVSLLPNFSQPYLGIGGGRIEMASFYRSHTDTPIAQNNLYQHQLNGYFDVNVANAIPLRVSLLLRRTNNAFFKNINDVQVEFDAGRFQYQLRQRLVKQVNVTQYLNDSVMKLADKISFLNYDSYFQKFREKFSEQRIIEAHEKIDVPEMTWDVQLPDSLAKRKSDSLKLEATYFLKSYEASKEMVDSLKKINDSILVLYHSVQSKLADAKKMLSGDLNDVLKERGENFLAASDKNEAVIPARYRWLFSLRKFSLGKSFLNYSQLAANNTPIKGINVEYNSWYYFAFSAGLLDFNFRNFYAGDRSNFHQYLVMARFGIGTIEKNHVILSFFRGNKQTVLPNAAFSLYKFNVSGVTIEAKYNLASSGYLKIEAGETVSPDLTTNPLKNTNWKLSDKSNKAYYIQLHYNFQKIDGVMDGYYKYMGANYQSFNVYRYNSAVNSYSLKWDQYFFRKQVKISAAIKSNEFTNPFILERYSSNTVFKTFSVTVRKRKWPTVSVAYMPLSQYSISGGLVIENKFNSLNINANHFYKLGDVMATTGMMLIRFYNTQVDSGFVYYNSKNININQTFNFRKFVAAAGIYFSKNPSYFFSCLDQNIQLLFTRLGILQFGAKINKLNGDASRLGFYTRYRFPLKSSYGFSFFFEKGYLATANGMLIKNSMGNIQLTKTFN